MLQCCSLRIALIGPSPNELTGSVWDNCRTGTRDHATTFAREVPFAQRSAELAESPSERTPTGATQGHAARGPANGAAALPRARLRAHAASAVRGHTGPGVGGCGL